jgi:ATP-dependent Lhr-like helicase
MGRWSVLPAVELGPGEEIVEQLLKRYGLITREVVGREEIPWSEIYPVCDWLESIGRIRRGYFVTGLSGIQYVLPDALERLREVSAQTEAGFYGLVWDDPANTLPLLMEKSAVETGTRCDLLVFQSGKVVMTANGKKLKITASLEPSSQDLAAALKQLTLMLADLFPAEKIVVTHYNNHPVGETPAAVVLSGLGFEAGYREYTLWPSRRTLKPI